MFRILSLAAAAAVLPLSALACDGFAAEDPYARASGATAQSGAAFMVLRNHGAADCLITAARSDAAARTELHSHVEDAQGVMRMVAIEDGIALPAGGLHPMARGGDHVMLLGLTAPLVQGETLVLTFVFADGAEATVDVPVDNDRAADGHGHSHGHGAARGD